MYLTTPVLATFLIILINPALSQPMAPANNQPDSHSHLSRLHNLFKLPTAVKKPAIQEERRYTDANGSEVLMQHISLRDCIQRVEPKSDKGPFFKPLWFAPSKSERVDLDKLSLSFLRFVVHATNKTATADSFMEIRFGDKRAYDIGSCALEVLSEAHWATFTGFRRLSGSWNRDDEAHWPYKDNY